MTAQTIWSGVLPVYLFLGGLGGALLVVCAVLDVVGARRFRRSVRAAAWCALFCLVVGVALLLVDVRVPARAIAFWESFVNPSSWLTRGAWLLVAAVPASFGYAFAVRGSWPGGVLRRAYAVLVALLGFCVAAYTGFLLMSAAAVPAWGTLLLPALFCASAASSALALMHALVWLRECKRRQSKARVLHVASLVTSIVEATILVAYVLWLLYASSDTKPSADLLLVGRYAPLFWGVAFLCGIGVPFASSLVALAAGKDARVRSLVCAVLVLAACLALRFLILAIGMYPPVELVPLT